MQYIEGLESYEPLLIEIEVGCPMSGSTRLLERKAGRQPESGATLSGSLAGQTTVDRRTAPPTLFPEAERVVEIPVTPALRIRQFVARNAYNFTHQERLERELRELLAAFGCAEARA